MQKMVRFLILVSFLTCSSYAEDPAKRATTLADEYVKEFISRFPESAQFSGLPDVPLDRLSDNSAEALKEWQKLEDGWAAELSKIDSASLWGKPEWITHGFLREVIDASRGLRICRQELWPVSQMAGWQTSVTQLISMQPVGTTEERTSALTRWSQFPRYLANEITNAREGVKLGYTSPRPNVELVIQQINGLLDLTWKESPFADPVQRTEDQEFQKKWTELANDQIIPAITRYRDFLRDDYINSARKSQAITAIPNGPECYRALFRSYTTLDRSPDETFELGKKTVARNQQEALETAQKSVKGIADSNGLLKYLEDDKSDRFESREKLMEFSREAVERAHKAMPQWFGVVPKAKVVVEPHPEFLEAAVASQYEPALEDGSRPATYRIKLYKPEEQRRSVVEVTAFHETWPGHHLQMAIAQEKPNAHKITRLVFNSGFVEGWARYSEALAEEAGVYTAKNSRITRRIWPARGMVMDPGLHLKGWTREQAVDWAMAGGRTRNEAERMVDRIAIIPAQLTAYDTGAIEIRALREKAEKQLGSKFEIREFHDALLGNGSVTLPMLRQIVDHWIQQKRP